MSGVIDRNVATVKSNQNTSPRKEEEEEEEEELKQ